MQAFKELFGRRHGVVIGMIHVRPLPGTPQYKQTVAQLIDIACQEALIYHGFGLDAVLIENMHDVPYIQGEEMGPEVTAVMTGISREVKRTIPSMPCGVQILAAANKQALAVALAAGCQFVRVEGFVFSHIADEGLLNACAGSLCRYRKYVDADHIKIFTDIKKKHCAHSITADVNLAATARAAEFFLSDGIVVTGQATANPPEHSEVRDVSQAVELPILIGSGVTKDNLPQFFPEANGFIIGSHFKTNGKWNGDLDKTRIEKFMRELRSLLSGKFL